VVALCLEVGLVCIAALSVWVVWIGRHHSHLQPPPQLSPPSPPIPPPPAPKGGYGGTEGAYTFVNSLVTLNTVTGDLTELHPSGVPPTARAYHTCSVVDHVAYIFGGRGADGVLAAEDPTLLCAYDSIQVGQGGAGVGRYRVGASALYCHPRCQGFQLHLASSPFLADV